jgi:hypothetical protein
MLLHRRACLLLRCGLTITTSCRLPLQKLALQKGQTRLHATVHVSLKLPGGGGKLELEPGTQPGLYVASGPPAKIAPQSIW